MYDAHGIYCVRATVRPGRVLEPSKQLNMVAGGVLARAARQFGVGLRGFAFTSHGLELLVRAHGTSVSHFMRFLLSTLSRKLSALYGWTGGLWNGRFRMEPVLDAQAEVECLIVLLRGALTIGLNGAWPPLTCLPWLLPNALRPRFRYFEWSRRAHNPASLRHVSRWSGALGSEETIELERVSSWAEFSHEMVTKLVGAIADGASAWDLRRPSEGFWATSPLVQQQFVVARRAFRRAYARASHALRCGASNVAFPPNCFRPSVPHEAVLKPGAAGAQQASNDLKPSNVRSLSAPRPRNAVTTKAMTTIVRFVPPSA
jgi:hypothetical protein